MAAAPPRLVRFTPPIVWMAVIAVLSSRYFGADHTESVFLAVAGRLLPWAGAETLDALHTAARKMGHLLEYGILAVLWTRALAPGRPPRRAAAWAVLVAALYAILDEARQGLVPNRTPSAHDVAIDTAGAILAVLAWHPGASPARVGLRLARWAALGLAGLSLAAALIDWAIGLRPWDLAFATVGLAGVAWGLRGLERAGAPPA